VRRALVFALDRSLLLLLGAAIALLWANASLDSYQRFAHAAHFAVNDVAMVFFFALATKEIVEATLPGGALASRKAAAVPLLAAGAIRSSRADGPSPAPPISRFHISSRG
jgi:NhaA family Na+:H+ antiporter